MSGNKPVPNPLLLRVLGMKHPYFIQTPWWLKKLYPRRTWNRDRNTNNIFLSFDDGPEPAITPYVLDELKKFNAKASFFCIGKNVEQYPEIYNRIKKEGHCIGNHSYTHPNGWKTNEQDFIRDILKASQHIKSDLFRPPYGRMTYRQAKKLKSVTSPPMNIIMWDVLSGDFDAEISPEQCLANVLKGTRPGSIIVFHDSLAAAEKLKWVLPRILEHFTKKGFLFKEL